MLHLSIMRLYVEPALSQWQPTLHESSHRRSLLEMAAIHADRLHTSRVTPSSLVLATGHQAWLWHPGILAKDIATQSAARQHQAGWFHLVVDTDVHDALTLHLPVRQGMRLRLEKLVLGKQQKLVPTGAHPPADVQVMRQAVVQGQQQWGDQLVVDVTRLLAAVDHLAQVKCQTLAEQMTVLQQQLIRPVVGDWPIVFESQLAGWTWLGELLRQMVADPHACVTAYNQAVMEHPGSGITNLRCEDKRVELPVWLMVLGKARLRVFAERSRTQFNLVDEQRRRVDLAGVLAGDAPMKLVPRALLLTAMLRSEGCDLFVHGRGGEHYDPVMETWWSLWQKTSLAPMTMVSADLMLNFDVPVNDKTLLERAQWWVHHLPHNVDRALHLQDGLALEKQHQLSRLSASLTKADKAQAFAKLHEVNALLAQQYEPLLEDARLQVQRYSAGFMNQALAQKRDWPVAWYPTESLSALGAMFT